MKKRSTIVLSILAGFSLISCSNMNNHNVGTLSSSVAGELVGSQIKHDNGQPPTVESSTTHAFLGGTIDKNMDEADKLKMNQTLERNSVGQPAYWQNKKTATNYTVVPVKNVTIENNQYCREYRITAAIAGKRQQIHATACRQPDGTWQAVS